jgi:hypothetical protein
LGGIQGAIKLGAICLRIIADLIAKIGWINVGNCALPIAPRACNEILSSF